MAKGYVLQVAIAIDQLANAVSGGYADETLSSRSYRLWRDNHPVGKVLMRVIDAMFFWQHHHCYEAFLSERESRHLPPEFRNE